MIDAALRILFIGNSLTAANDLPGMVEALGRAAGVEMQCAAVAKPNFPLGSTLAALVIVNRLTGRLPPAAAMPGVSAQDFEALVLATREVSPAVAVPR